MDPAMDPAVDVDSDSALASALTSFSVDFAPLDSAPVRVAANLLLSFEQPVDTVGCCAGPDL